MCHTAQHDRVLDRAERLLVTAARSESRVLYGEVHLLDANRCHAASYSVQSSHFDPLRILPERPATG